ncbi:uncharacterized protein BDR25DRAFT_307622 [Lindgomyces ingoldianus]|uniref:Uncharacterized protein n=1 Tax=Lindgomyces ingoldianus TaxID=673940 RepID=A0ACB6QCA2_9PLEO|nr:uncharacterized protein BDR25DRAFT_307622 [Lindgomyces ingoldianus]KAF2463747.1 hypothetical protein BDR25DRAFT_307622 [Lindgomyces ingoldianus]
MTGSQSNPETTITPSLLGLPPEMRVMIYKELLQIGQTHTTFEVPVPWIESKEADPARPKEKESILALAQHSEENEATPAPLSRITLLAKSIPCSIVATCKQIHSEAQPILQRSQTDILNQQPRLILDLETLGRFCAPLSSPSDEILRALLGWSPNGEVFRDLVGWFTEVNKNPSYGLGFSDYLENNGFASREPISAWPPRIRLGISRFTEQAKKALIHQWNQVQQFPVITPSPRTGLEIGIVFPEDWESLRFGRDGLPLRLRLVVPSLPVPEGGGSKKEWCSALLMGVILGEAAFGSREDRVRLGPMRVGNPVGKREWYREWQEGKLLGKAP